MKTKDKQELVRLLHLYMDDIVEANEDLKAQYEHARILATKLSVEVGKDIKSYWEL